MAGTFSSCRNNCTGKSQKGAKKTKAKCAYTHSGKSTSSHKHPCICTLVFIKKCLYLVNWFGFYSLKFQVILFLRQKPVECYIGVDGVDLNALGHLDTGRCREGGQWDRNARSRSETTKGDFLYRWFEQSSTLTPLSSAGIWACSVLSSTSFSISISGTGVSGSSETICFRKWLEESPDAHSVKWTLNLSHRQSHNR